MKILDLTVGKGDNPSNASETVLPPSFEVRDLDERSAGPKLHTDSKRPKTDRFAASLALRCS